MNSGKDGSRTVQHETRPRISTYLVFVRDLNLASGFITSSIASWSLDIVVPRYSLRSI